MKLLLYSFLLLGFTANAQAPANTTWYTIQTKERYMPITTKTQTERYGVDYELVDYVFENGDSTILEQLNLDHLESLRETTRSVIVIDKALDVKVKLYAIRFDTFNSEH